MHQGRKSQRKKRETCILKNKLIIGIATATLTLICLLAFSSFYSENPHSHDQAGTLKAALIDHLSFLTPNQAFKTGCMSILHEAGFNVTYHEGEEVTVDFYKNLPEKDYNLMVLRVHSAVIKDSKGNLTDLIGLFTSEILNETTEAKYDSDLKEGKLAYARFLTYGTNDTYLGITPHFVKSSMAGNFEGTAIIMMGCEGLNRTSMADEFVQRGAKVYISWTGPVSISHTDQSTIHLLQNLLLKNQTIKNAVKAISRDPEWQWSTLDYYPNKGDEDVGNHRIQHFISDLVINVAETSLVSFNLGSQEQGCFRLKRPTKCVV